MHILFPQTSNPKPTPTVERMCCGCDIYTDDTHSRTNSTNNRGNKAAGDVKHNHSNDNNRLFDNTHNKNENKITEIVQK